MSDELRFILSLGIIPAVIIGIARFRRIDPTYYPFVYNVSFVLLVEIIVWFIKSANIAGTYAGVNIAQNVFAIIDIALFTWLFHNWGLFNYNRKVFIAVLGIFLAAWLTITVFIYGIERFGLYFLGLYSFILVFFSITTFGKVIIQERINLFSNAKFWICLAILIFYTFFIIFCTTQITLFNLKVSIGFQNNLHRIIAYCNLLANLLYAVAALWIPRKKNYINLSS